MTHRHDYIVAQELVEKRLEGVPEVMRVLINNIMQVERAKFLQVAIQKYAVSAPRLSAWLEENLSDGFTVFDFPLERLRLLRTPNSLERINKEIRRRTRIVGVFPNEASCLRLISALLMEISEDQSIIYSLHIARSFQICKES